MKRVERPVRPAWAQRIAEEGLVYHQTTLPNGTTRSYWREGAAYSFSAAEIVLLEEAAATLFDMLVQAGDYIIAHNQQDADGTMINILMQRMQIPPAFYPAITASWNQEPPCQSVYGRFDICFGGSDHPDPSMRVPRLYEFNSDTPTSLLESAITQWYAYVDTKSKGEDQWNGIHEALVEAWKRNLGLLEQQLGFKPKVTFLFSSEDDSHEDEMNVAELAETCQQAGYQVRMEYIEQVQLASDGRFYLAPQGTRPQDSYEAGELEHLDVCFKLHPWEMLWNSDPLWVEAIVSDMARVGQHDQDGNYTGGTYWIEAPYKALWSNKAILAILWDMFGDPNSSLYDPEKARYLIPAWLEDKQPNNLGSFVRKPIFGREGANVQFVQGGTVVNQGTDQQYGSEGFIVQQLAELPEFTTADGETMRPVLGIWLIDGVPAGMGIREDTSAITGNTSFFISHVIEGGMQVIGQSHPRPGAAHDMFVIGAQHAPVFDDKPANAISGNPTFGEVH